MAIVRGIVIGRLDMSQTLVYVVVLAASAAGLFVTIAQIYAFGASDGSGIFWPAVAVGAIAGFQVDTGEPGKRPSGHSN